MFQYFEPGSKVKTSQVKRGQKSVHKVQKERRRHLHLHPVGFNPFGCLGNICFALGHGKAEGYKLLLHVGQEHAVAAEDQQHGRHADALISIYKAKILR